MGFDCGFDIYPQLEATALNKETYRRFLDEIIRTYENVYDKEGRMADGKILDIPTNSHHSDKIYISFMVGECPHMPSNPDRCDYFLRFSSKVSGRLTTPAEPYIRSVYNIAKKYFGGRVHFWHEMNETGGKRQWGYYDWQEVHDADRKLRELEIGQEQDLQNRDLEERVRETNDEPNLSSVTLPTRANLTRSACNVDLHLRSQPGATGSGRTGARSPTLSSSAAPMMSPTVSRADNIDLSDLMKSISLGNRIKYGPEGKSHINRSSNPEPTTSVNVLDHSRALKYQLDETSASPAEVAVMQQIMAVALSPRTKSISWEGNLLGLVAFDALHAALQITGLQVQVDFGAAWAQHLTGPEIAKLVLDCDESKTPVSAEVQKELQEVAAAALNDMSKPTSGMCSSREYLVQVLQAMRRRKGGDETFKSLIDRGIEVVHGEELITVEETHNNGQTDEQEKWVPCDSDYDCDGYSDSYDYDDYHEPLKDLTACDKECGYCGQCDY